MKISLHLLQLTIIAAAVSACGSSDTATTPTTPTAPTPTATPSYLSLTEKGSKTSSLGGVLLNFDTSNYTVTWPFGLSGSLNHETGAVTVTHDSGYSLTDTDGFNDDGELTEGEELIRTNDSAADYAGTYDYVRRADVVYDTKPYYDAGVFGVVTNSEDMPNATTATYEGDADALFKGVYLHRGKSHVSADFGAGTVDVTLSDFTVYNSSDSLPVDTISAKDMEISGNAFSGDTVIAMKDNAIIELVGGTVNSKAKGNFFGYDGLISAPDEVGGVLMSSSGPETIIGIFVAD